MEMIIGIVFGIIIGVFCGRYIIRRNAIGSLRIDQSDPDSGPYLFLELSHKGSENIHKKKYVVFQVNVKDYIPHK